jgi:phenylacetaldehyde dehydrogenase
VCTAGSRLYAHRNVFDRVLDGIAQRANTLKVGSGIDPVSEMGPLISQRQLDRVLGYADSGRADGAEIVAGGHRLDRPGYFMSPTVMTGTRPDMAVRREEIFGPVLCAESFDDDDLKAIAAEANDTVYGLMTYVWTSDLGVAHKIARLLKAGTVRVNGGAMDSALPFGGFKQSGWGRENGLEGLQAYTEMKSVLIGLDA